MSSHYKSNKSLSGSDKGKEENLAHTSRDNPAHKRDQLKGRSEIIQRLIKEKESKKDATLRAEKEKKERVEKQQNTFRIPKKKPEPPIDVKRLIDSLFDDSDIPNGQPDKSDKKGLISVNGNSNDHVQLSSLPSLKENSVGSVTDNHRDPKEKSSDRKSHSSNNHKTGSEHRHSNSDVKSDKSRNDQQSLDSSKHEHHQSSKSDHEHSHRSSKGHRSDSTKHLHNTNLEHAHHLSRDHKSDSSKHRHKSDPESSHHSSKDHKSDSSKHHHQSAHHSSKDQKSDSSKHHHKSDRESSHHSAKDDHKSHGLSDVSREHKSYDASSSSKSTSSHRHKSSHHSKSRSSEHSVRESTSTTKETTSSLPKPESTSSVAPPQSSSSSSSKPELKSVSTSSLSSPPHPHLSTSDQQPVILTKHHLNPTVERQANHILSEKEKILARLAAIKQRTLEAIHKESSGKRKRSSGDKSHRKTKAEVKVDDKAKSVEIIKEVVSSDEEEEINNDVPSALDIMLSERTAKLEKEKIARMAKQAWERAMKKDKGEADEEVKIKKKRAIKGDKSSSKNLHKSESSKSHSNHKKKEHSLSPAGESRTSPPKPKKRPIVRHAAHAPPPIDFKTILEMAERKQKEPNKPVVAVQNKKKEEEKRPLTQEEKDRIEWKKSKEYQDWLKFGGPPPGKKNEHSDGDIDKDSDDDDNDDEAATSHNILVKKEIPKRMPGSGSENNSYSSQKSFSKNDNNGIHSHGQMKPRADVRNPHKNITVNENVLVCGPGGSSEDEASHKKSENPFDRIMSQFQKRKAPQSQRVVPGKRSRLEDSEEEDEDYDSDLDSFIDDGEGDEPNISAEIKKIFNYDKSKYKNEKDDDLSDMEADFATVMKEEKRSAKLGLMEDLEDMRKEQEELRRKALMKKKK